MLYLSESFTLCTPAFFCTLSICQNCWHRLISAPVSWYTTPQNEVVLQTGLGMFQWWNAAFYDQRDRKNRVDWVQSVWRQHGGMVESWWPAWPWQLHLPAVMHPGDRGQGLSPAVSTPIGFHGSSLISRICHCRGVFLLEGFNPCCHGSQAPSSPS